MLVLSASLGALALFPLLISAKPVAVSRSLNPAAIGNAPLTTISRREEIGCQKAERECEDGWGVDSSCYYFEDYCDCSDLLVDCEEEEDCEDYNYYCDEPPENDLPDIIVTARVGFENCNEVAPLGEVRVQPNNGCQSLSDFNGAQAIYVDASQAVAQGAGCKVSTFSDFGCVTEDRIEFERAPDRCFLGDNGGDNQSPFGGNLPDIPETGPIKSINIDCEVPVVATLPGRRV